MLKNIVLILCLLFFSQTISAQKVANVASFDPTQRPKNLSDSALLDLVQWQTFRYFWDFAHPESGMARERSNTNNYGHETVTTGGTGFGIMNTVVAVKRNFIGRDTAAKFLVKLVSFLLKKADSYHGVFPHWMNGTTGKTIPFSRKDDGADLVETSYLLQGLLTARQFFNDPNSRVERELRGKINTLWNDVEWNWFTKGGEEVLYWHWSPNNGWAMNFPLRGYNECLITYVLAASGTRYPVSSEVYHRGWAQGINFRNGKTYYGFELPLGSEYGGPLFFSQYTYLGLNPHGLKDRYADYWKLNTSHSMINYSYCVDNPKDFKGYGKNSWGLTSGDSYNGYNGSSPTNDNGTITITAALSAFPYTPTESMAALKHFYYDLGDKVWSEYGFTDGFSEAKNWYATSHLAIDQGPIIVMIENYRSGLLWDLFMSCPEVQAGLLKFGFSSPYISLANMPASR